MNQPGKPWVRKHGYASAAIVARGRAYPTLVEEILAVVRTAQSHLEQSFQEGGRGRWHDLLLDSER